MGITSLRAWILAASLLAVSAVAHGAGLGKLNVTSALGEPLSAEIELFAEKKEIGSLAARLASAEAFARAGLVYANALDNAKVGIEKRANGEPYVRLTTTQPVNEPFLDLLVELSWASGRISREFTALLDPPSLIAERARQKAAEAQVRASPPKPEPQPEPIAEPAAQTPTAEAPAPEAAPAVEAPAAAQAPAVAEAPAAEPAPSAPVETIGGPMATFLTESNVNSTSRGSTAASSASGESYGPVKRGDTLAKIALATKPADVSLEQMLVLLFRGNPDAFAGKNMNRLKTGKIIKLPSPERYGSVAPAAARKEVLVQARNWNAYREQLAVAAGEATPAAEPAKQAAAGKITTKVEDQAAAAKQQPKEVLKLSQSESAPAAAAVPTGDGKAGPGQGKAQARVRALEEELVARDKAVKDANERVGKLEKTIKDLQALLEIKNKGMADMQKPAAPPPATPAQPVPAQPAPKPAAKPETHATAPVAPAPTPEARPSPAQTPAAPVAPQPKTETAPPSQPAPPPKPAPRPAPPPAPEPGLLDRLLEEPAYLGAGLGVLVLIGALAVRAVKRRRESKAEAEEAGPASVVGTAPPSSRAFNSTDTDLSAANARAANDIAEEVDPVAEAEIFLAYGRDAQAEDLLKEALAASPTRYEIHLKLLQILANRKDTKAFEQLARELQKGTGGSGDLWDQAVRLGYQIDPDNPRYAAGEPIGGGAAAVAAVSVAGAADNVDFNIGFEDPNATTSTDIDLGDDGGQLDKTQVIEPSPFGPREDTVLETGGSPTMNFSVELPPAGTAAEETEAPKKQEGNSIDFDFDLNALAAPSAAVPAAEEPKPAAGGLDFDMSETSLEAPGEPKDSSGAVQEIDLSGINLDLGTGTSPQVSAMGKDDHWYDVQTKFDLAKAYQEMGDKDGAREILKEVLQEGDAEQKAAAQTVLANLDS
ncbi:MAG TPA: FimV/HubP family polar landmark protein [Burkholderiales bacterium]|nr:FimV/HubP family polar landmark protein [Burkholderiales bacterium]